MEYAQIVNFALVVLTIAGYWFLFKKAGEPGWKAIIPIYNVYILLKIVGKPWWWLILLVIPFVNIIFVAMLVYALSKAFGNGGWFAVGLFFLPFIFVPILGFGEARYVSGGSTGEVKEAEVVENTNQPTEPTE